MKYIYKSADLAQIKARCKVQNALCTYNRITLQFYASRNLVQIPIFNLLQKFICESEKMLRPSVSTILQKYVE